MLVIGRHESGMDYGSVDHAPCDLFLLLLTSARNPAEHLKLLSAAAHILGDADIRRTLRAAASPQAFLAVLAHVAEQNVAPADESPRPASPLPGDYKPRET